LGDFSANSSGHPDLGEKTKKEKKCENGDDSESGKLSANSWRLRLRNNGVEQGCQIACFQAKNPNLGKFWRVFQWKMLVHKSYGYLVYFMYGQLIYFVAIWYILCLFGILFPFLVHYMKKKSGNPGVERGSTMAGDSKQ
jgi:hypothetical protein